MVTVMTAMGIFLASFVTTSLYALIRKIFNRLDQLGHPLKMSELLFFFALFATTMTFTWEKVAMTMLATHMGSMVVMSFLAFMDYKTKLLHVAAILYLFLQSLLFYLLSCLLDGEFKHPGGITLCVYALSVLLCCFAKAIAIGDGCIYLALLPVMALLQWEEDFPFMLLFLLLPLLLFPIVEGGKAILRKNLGSLLRERKAFAPYLLFGYVACYLLYANVDMGIPASLW